MGIGSFVGNFVDDVATQGARALTRKNYANSMSKVFTDGKVKEVGNIANKLGAGKGYSKISKQYADALASGSEEAIEKASTRARMFTDAMTNRAMRRGAYDNFSLNRAIQGGISGGIYGSAGGAVIGGAVEALDGDDEGFVSGALKGGLIGGALGTTGGALWKGDVGGIATKISQWGSETGSGINNHLHQVAKNIADKTAK